MFTAKLGDIFSCSHWLKVIVLISVGRRYRDNYLTEEDGLAKYNLSADCQSISVV